MKYYAVIDTNALVCAMLKWDFVPGNVLELVFARTIVPLLNADIAAEYRKVPARPKVGFTADIIGVVGELERPGILVGHFRVWGCLSGFLGTTCSQTGGVKVAEIFKIRRGRD